MSRFSGDYDGGEPWAYIRWRGAVKSALRGRPGQANLRRLLAALDRFPKRALIPIAESETTRRVT